jgi:hypothetical protein
MGKAHRLKSPRRALAFFSTATTPRQLWLQRQIQTGRNKLNNQPNENRRANLTKIVREVLNKMPTARTYALGTDAERTLTALLAAVFERRQIQGRAATDEPVAQKEFMEFLTVLAGSGCNILQARPTDPKPLPAVWTNPLTGQPLPPPKGIAERSLLQKLDPELLRLFDELEKSPYQTVSEMREGEAKRQAMAAIKYDGNTHEANPFRRGEQTEMAALFKRDPLLASFCEQEARPVELNLFGAQRDLTVRGKLFKDPSASAIVELAEKIHEQWRMEDKAAAAEAKTAAEAQLKALAAQDEVEPPRLAARARVGAE